MSTESSEEASAVVDEVVDECLATHVSVVADNNIMDRATTNLMRYILFNEILVY